MKTPLKGGFSYITIPGIFVHIFEFSYMTLHYVKRDILFSLTLAHVFDADWRPLGLVTVFP
jgi:hypothetical protein